MENVLKNRIILSRAWNYHLSTGIEMDDLISEGLMAYLRCEKEYRENQNTSFSTYLYRAVDNAMLEYIRFCKKANTILVDDFSECSFFDMQKLTTPPKEPMLGLNLNKFSHDVKELIKFVLKQKDDFDLNYCRKNRGILAERLKQSGWTQKRIWDAFREIKHIIKITPENELFQ